MTCPERPPRPSNRPGLPTLRYRIGDYASFRARLLERLTCVLVTSDQPQGISLRQLNTRTNDDPAIALLDACAVVADVLTFYQERIINEGYLMTATERRSVLELARTIGYELHPGVAASTLLAFSVEETPNSPKTAAITKGTQILSVPEQDELPQTFETSADFTAHVEWNALKPRPDRPQKIIPSTDRLFLKGTSTGLQPGDLLVLMDGDDISKPYYLLTIVRVESNPAKGYTLIFWQPQTLEPPPRNPKAIAFRQRANLFGFNAPLWDTVLDAIKLATGSKIKGGIYRASEGAKLQWQSVNTGLLNFDIRCLVVNTNGVLLAGTPIGLFRSQDNGETWKLANSGLTNFDIQTIYAGKDLLVGTPGGGVFRSTDDGETWSPIGIGSVTVRTTQNNQTQTSEPINTGIPNTVVRSLAAISLTFAAPTLSSTDTTVRITRGAGILPLNLQIDDVIVAVDQVRYVTAVTPVDPTISASLKVTINDSFRNSPTADSLTGTRRDLESNTTFFAYRPSRTTTASPLLPTGRGGNLILAATDMGIYRSNDQGQNWYKSDNPNGQVVRALVTCPDLVFAKTDLGIYQSNDLGESWTSTNLNNTGKIIRSLVTYENDAFVAASDGVYRSRNGENWEPVGNISTGLTDVNVWSLAVNATNGNLFAFTASGVFKSVNQGNNWTLWSGESQIPDLTIVLPCAKSGIGNSTFLFAGAAFTGFEKEGEEGWHNFHLPTPQPGEDGQIDLSTTYPKLLAGSWLILQSGDRKTNQLCQIKSITDIQRRDFTLDSKISRIFTDTFIEHPEHFNLREAIVLVQSESLPLINEPLTVTVQQTNIFFDPVWENKVLLSQYVAGLQAQHPVIINGKRIRAELLNAGGIVQQIFPSSNTELRWLRTNNGLTNTSVTAFAAHSKPEAGNISNNLNAIRGIGTAFTEELKVGIFLEIEIEKPSKETAFTEGLKAGFSLEKEKHLKEVEAIYADVSLVVKSGTSLEIVKEILFKYVGTGTGAIASKDKTVTGSNTLFKQELKVGVKLIISEQEIEVTQINSDTSLTLKSAFTSDIPPGTPFQYRGEGKGKIKTDGSAIKGTDTEFTKALRQGQALSINNKTYQIERIISDNLLFVDADVDIKNDSFSFSSNTLFVGTAGGGVFQSLDNGETWEAINEGLTTLMIQAIAVRSVRGSRQAGYQLFVGTEIGVFYTNFIFHPDTPVKWQQVNSNLVYADVRSLLAVEININSRKGILLAGTINGGVLVLVAEAEAKFSWLQTGLTNVDVQTLMLAPDGDIYAGTVADGVFRGVVSDLGITWQPLSKGLTANPNVTSLVSYLKPGNSKFNLTQVFAGTLGSGIFRLKPDADGGAIWEPVANNPADLNVLSLTVDATGKTLFAGTASGGIFRSIDDGNLWAPMNAGLTSLDAQINPAAKVNTEFRAITLINQTLFAAGIGILISPDHLYTIPIRTGDRLQVMAPPVPLPEKGRENPALIAEQKWTLSERDGFTGVVFTAQSTDVRLQPADVEDALVSEQNAIALPPQDQQEPLLTLSNPIQNSYDPETVKIYANVVPATHGETIQEILGNGDSTLTHQKFFLQKPPLTYVSATTPRGAATTLQVRVNEVLWQEVPSLYQRSPRDPVYITRIGDDRSVTITVGDGISGARLPTGIDNVTATYRSGIGLAGLVGADHLSLLKTRPLGIAAVTNPLPATGAADPETMAEARISAPLTVRTLDRIVSLQDYEDFARAFAGIGKAQAELITAGETQLVHITVAAIGGNPVLPNTPLYTNLVQAIDACRDPVQQVRISSYESLAFNLEGKLLIDPRYLSDRVIAQAKTALLQRFEFEQRQFGQSVTAAEAIATLQTVAGMIAVDLDALYRRDRARSLEQSVAALSARWDTTTREILPAQLLVINPAGIRLRVEATL